MQPLFGSGVEHIIPAVNCRGGLKCEDLSVSLPSHKQVQERREPTVENARGRHNVNWQTVPILKPYSGGSCSRGSFCGDPRLRDKNEVNAKETAAVIGTRM